MVGIVEVKCWLGEGGREVRRDMLGSRGGRDRMKDVSEVVKGSGRD